MFLRSLITICLLLTVSASTFARKPAVEDFVGVESEHYKKTPKGTEVLFNFEKQIQQSQTQDTSNWSNSTWFGMFALAAFAALPFLMWFSIMGISNKESEANTVQSNQPTHQSQPDVTPVTHLDDYRKEKDDDVKKAS